FKMCDDPHEIMLCAVRDGKILGLARTVMRGNAGDAVTLSRVRAVMEELAVLPQAQGMGIGTALLYASEAEAKRRGAESLELMVWSFNKSAMRFYESAGMTVRSFVMEKKL
ncbi:GNAT family N-acetyltransferase, partial [Hominenteromicrobium sp.]